jgi:hypothetical protein
LSGCFAVASSHARPIDVCHYPLWVNVGNNSEAMKVINIMLNQPVSFTNPSLHALFQLMNLMMNALMSNADYLHYAIRSMNRKLKAIGNFTKRNN